MIVYDSKSWRSMLIWKGSVLPRATFYALLFSLAAAVLKYVDLHHFQLIVPGAVLNNSLFGGFTMTLGFTLVFRTGQCYSRFCQCSVALSKMGAQLHEAASNLVAFSTIKEEKQETAEIFRQMILRLFSLLHACCLEAITEIGHEDFPVLDISGIAHEDLEVLSHFHGRLRVDLVYQWILTLVVQNLNGVLGVPPPILTRVFQELEASMMQFNDILQIIEIPFPFPYAQATRILMIMYSFVTPAVVLFWTSNAYWAFISTFVCLIGIFSLELIATEIENPFGQDANDLPAMMFQEHINASLLMLLNPMAKHIPNLSITAKTDFEALTTGNARFKSFTKALQDTDFVQTCRRRTVRSMALKSAMQQVTDTSPVQQSTDSAPPVQQCKDSSPPVQISSGFLQGGQQKLPTQAGDKEKGSTQPEWALELLQRQGTLHKDFLYSLNEILCERLPQPDRPAGHQGHPESAGIPGRPGHQRPISQTNSNSGPWHAPRAIFGYCTTDASAPKVIMPRVLHNPTTPQQ